MGKLYSYVTSEFGLTSGSIHLLRNEFSYNTLNFSEIDSIEIKRGKAFKNWLLVFCFGFGLFTFSTYYIVDLMSPINHLNKLVTNGELIIVIFLPPLLPFFLGIYTMINSLKDTTIMKVGIQNKNYYFSLKELIKNKSYNDFIFELKLLHPTIKIHEYYS
jgi:hypothetical protein